MGTVVIVDVGIGNLRSVQKAVERAAADARLDWRAIITPDPSAIDGADKVIVPGQGAFRDCVERGIARVAGARHFRRDQRQARARAA
jgi:glutamine amidotransferase